jgi:hypothetical protein
MWHMVVVEVRFPPPALSPEHTHSLQLLRDAFCFVLFCLWMCVICFVSFFFSQATKGLEKGTGNCICGEIEQMGLSRSCMDRWTDGQMGEDAQGSKMTPGGCLGMSAADTGGQALK